MTDRFLYAVYCQSFNYKLQGLQLTVANPSNSSETDQAKIACAAALGVLHAHRVISNTGGVEIMPMPDLIKEVGKKIEG